MVDFRTLAAALEAHPDIWVARAQILPGADPEDLARAEAHLGAPLDPEVKAFYAAHNGLAISWMWKPSDRFQDFSYDVDTSELPFWMDLMQNYGPPFDGQIIVAPIGEVFVDSYESIEEPSDFAPDIAYMEYFEVPKGSETGKFSLGERNFGSEAAFRSQLRIFDYYVRDNGNLMLFETGNSDPDLFHLEDDWANFQPDLVLSLSKYLHHVAHDFGLVWHRNRYFRGAEPAPASFDPAARLEQLVAETEFPGDRR